MKMRIHHATLECVQGDITEQDTDVIVNAANESLIGGGGVDGAIRRAAGPAVELELEKIRQEMGGCPTGTAVLTSGGKLKARWIVHTVGPIWANGEQNEAQQLSSAYRESLKLAEAQGAKSISFPAISTGVYGYPVEQASRIAGQSIIDYLKGKTKLNLVRLVLFDSNTKDVFARTLISLLPTKRY
jgi:O-acetyl-ADP-ribose deacetylase (regulator of RNase III)